MKKRHRIVLVVLGLGGLGAALADSKDGPSRAKKPVAVASVDETFKVAAELAAEREQLGAQLVEFLDDEFMPHEVRVRSAKMLGELRYRPAIPVLIRHIGLWDSSIKVISGNEDEPFVCIQALPKIGEAAVPSIIDAYLKEKDWIRNRTQKSDRRRFHFLSCLSDPRMRIPAVIHMQGLRELKDPRLTEGKKKEFFDLFWTTVHSVRHRLRKR